MEFTPEQEMLRESVRAFAIQEMPEGFAREWDMKGEPPLDTYQRFADAGFMGVGIPEQYGGQGGGIVEVAIVLHELSRAMMSFAIMVYRSAIHASGGLQIYGTEEQRERFLPGIASGHLKFCFSLSEPDAGSDAFNLKCRAVRDGDEYVVNGTKMWNSFARHADNVLLATRTSDEPRKQDGITFFVVDLSSPGIEITPIETIGERASGTNMVTYTDVRVPAANILGTEGEGHRNLQANLERERFSSLPINLGPMEAILEEAVEYANTREQFGQAIGRFQAIQHMLADVAVDVNIARTLTWDLARRIAAGEPCSLEVSMAKLWISEAMMRASYTGMQVMGGYGYTLDSNMQLHWRNARLGTIGAGSSEIQRNIIARQIGLGGQPS
ncbi:MAG: acyl-CoA dehydrogenase family protein [bacterium]|nr:acyl-CoA dehydrogenase family protein [bacterium]MXZ78444.1 acyl-CoA dehydrogenase [Acidimicrobiia bacterium]MDE0613589.1 acyl-CoA dehydrogenase family protein [bacterium]MYB10235.1 acyl-CoA dehydrogenase [Acidimicrobiia bacterium]MYE72574.1 acyl-CoA dehydrogenase [Acidimicrobiia bacterium]